MTQERLHDTTTLKGRVAETKAVLFLETAGLSLVEKNFSVRGGEIDLIMMDGKTLVFVEVRQRKSAAFGGALGSITPTKQHRLILAAQHYLQRYRQIPSCRFDCLLFEGASDNPPTWLKNAFTADAF